MNQYVSQLSVKGAELVLEIVSLIFLSTEFENLPRM